MENTPIFNTFLQDFLGQTIIDQPYIYVDYWSLIHFISGLTLGWLFSIYYPQKFSWLVAFLILVVYEIFEILLIGTLFVSETPIDQLGDLIIGMAGFFIFNYVFKKNNSK